MERDTTTQRAVITVKLRRALFSELPSDLRGGLLIKVIPVLIQQGINEFQTLANRKAKKSRLQRVLNTKAVEQLRGYLDELVRQKDYLEFKDARVSQMQMLFHRLDTLVQVEDCKEANVQKFFEHRSNSFVLSEVEERHAASLRKIGLPCRLPGK